MYSQPGGHALKVPVSRLHVNYIRIVICSHYNGECGLIPRINAFPSLRDCVKPDDIETSPFVFMSTCLMRGQWSVVRSLCT
jgi:hypothetical protein